MREDISSTADRGIVDEIERATSRVAEDAVIIEEVQSLPVALMQTEISPT